MTIRIGVNDSTQRNWQAEHTQAELARIGIQGEIVTFALPESGGDGITPAEQALLRGEIDAVVHALEHLPTTQPEGLCITALSAREDVSTTLLLHQASVDPKQWFKIKAGGILAGKGGTFKAQMLQSRGDLQWVDLSGDLPAELARLQSEELDGVLIPTAELMRAAVDTGAFVSILLDPRELIPTPGQGVIAWQTNRNDLPTRRIFRQIHHVEVSACTNIEREILRQLKDDAAYALGVWCERNALGHYNIYGACSIGGSMQQIKTSSSTFIGVPARVITMFGL